MNDHTVTILDYLTARADPPIELEPDEDIFASGAIDSLQVADLVSHLEATFGVEIPLCDVNVENFSTVAAIASYLTRKVSRT